MAQAELSVGIDLLRGKLKRSSEVVTRLKEYRADDGSIIKYGPQEIYFKEKRDYTRHPKRGAEEVQAQKWKAACRGASVIIKDKSHPRYGELRARWNAQLKGQPDPILDPKRVTMFPNFVRVILLRELESGRIP